MLLFLAGATRGAHPAAAHGLGMSQLRMRVSGAQVDGTWELQPGDARLALGLDPHATGDTGWRELNDHRAALRDLLARDMALAADGRTCPVTFADGPLAAAALTSTQPDQVVVGFVASCPSEPSRLAIRCDLLFDLDPKHRAYFSVDDARVTHLGLFRADNRSVTVDVHHFHPWAGFVEFVGEGVRHIWGGLDHLLFLLALLLPAPLVRAADVWSPRAGFGATVREVLKVVTAFTAAHSLTLGLSFFGLVTLPSRWVELAIALSVFAAAWNNLRPFLPGRAWVLALAFGLVHGLGFAGALRNLSLPSRARGLALLGFNVGVEVGQLAIVVLILPILYAAARRTFYPRRLMGAGSLGIAWLAVMWSLQRGFGLSLFS